MEIIRPKKRSKLRITLGKWYFTLKRYYAWYFSGVKFVKTKNETLLPFINFKHKTPLYRKLKNTDMYLQKNKVTNLKIAVEKIDGIIIKPGEVFSYWKLIGKTTRKKGYVNGMVLHYGKVIEGIGGGLCQLSNLIYWMSLHSQLTVIERYRHSFDVFPDSNRTQPFGSGATCSYNYKDLQILNNTDVDIQIKVYFKDDHLVGELRTSEKQLYKYEIYEKEHKITHEYWGDYVRHNAIWRKVYNLNNELIKDEHITENHAIMMYQPLLHNVNK